MIHLSEKDYSVTCAGEKIHLLPKEFALFEFLYRNKGLVFTRDELLDRVWRMEDPGDRTVDDHIYRIRKKLKRWDTFLKINTIRGQGYRLELKEQRMNLDLSERDPELEDQIRTLFRRYHRLGKGDALRVLANNQKTLGIHLTEEQNSYARLMNGDLWWYVQTPDIPFSEKLFYLLHLHHYLNTDVQKSLHFYEKAYRLSIMPEKYQKELVMNIIWLYIEAGKLEEAQQQIDKARKLIESENLEGFVPFFFLSEMFFFLVAGKAEAVTRKIEEMEQLLDIRPYLRERGLFQVSKGLWYLRKGNKPDAISLLDEGLDTLKESQFIFHFMAGIRNILFFVGRFCKEPDLQAKYCRYWDDLDAQYHFSELNKEIEQLLNTRL